MKVLLIADGTSIHSRRVLDWHLKNGCEVTFVDYENPKPNGDGAYRFVRYPGLRGSRYLAKLIGNWLVSRLNDCVVANGLRRIFHEARPNVVHLYQIDTRAYHCLRARLKPMVMSSWGTDINQHFNGSLVDSDYHRRTAEAIANADVIIADAADVIDKCARLAGRAVNAELLPLGVDTELFRPGYKEAARRWRRRMAIPDDAPVFLSIRALTPLYGHNHILDAFHLAFPRFAKQAFLVFKAYNDKSAPNYKQELNLQGERLGIANWLRFCESVPFEQLPSLYAAATAIINYPSMDGFPVTFLEAAACKCQVITNRLPSYQGTLAETYFRIVEPGNLNALADALVETVNETDPMCEARLDDARATVKETFSETASAGRLMAIYKNLAIEHSIGADGETAQYE